MSKVDIYLIFSEKWQRLYWVTLSKTELMKCNYMGDIGIQSIEMKFCLWIKKFLNQIGPFTSAINVVIFFWIEGRKMLKVNKPDCSIFSLIMLACMRYVKGNKIRQFSENRLLGEWKGVANLNANMSFLKFEASKLIFRIMILNKNRCFSEFFEIRP